MYKNVPNHQPVECFGISSIELESLGDGWRWFPRLKNLKTDIETRRGLSMLDAAWPRIIIDPVGCAQHKEPSYHDKGENLQFQSAK